jgi:exosortase
VGTLTRCASLVLLPVALLWSYWSVVAGLLRDWRSNDNYSVGQLVPLAAVYLLWQERHALARLAAKPSGWGVLLILFAQALLAFGLLFLFESAERYSLVIAVAGVVLMVCGRKVFRQVSWILLFLFLMVPLPGRIHNLISGPLQDLATVGAVAALELAGVTVTRAGHVMVLNDRVHVAVAEACSGLRMLTAFIVVAAVLAYIVPRPRWQKAVLVISSIPVAIVCNLLRLVTTALLFMVTSSQTAERFFHDFAGWTMMPMAVVILLGELWMMSRLILPEPRLETI